MLWGGCVLIKLRTAVIGTVAPASPCIIALLPMTRSFSSSSFHQRQTVFVGMEIFVLLHCALANTGE